MWNKIMQAKPSWMPDVLWKMLIFLNICAGGAVVIMLLWLLGETIGDFITGTLGSEIKSFLGE
jgi:hypothetical protein